MAERSLKAREDAHVLENWEIRGVVRSEAPSHLLLFQGLAKIT
ncbi:hypothetical protein [Bradyrhizobium sp. CCGUVB1N3]|nr:hypothetical protein [Bradyrhizobium sp. CCGUVB1N3]